MYKYLCICALALILLWVINLVCFEIVEIELKWRLIPIVIILIIMTLMYFDWYFTKTYEVKAHLIEKQVVGRKTDNSYVTVWRTQEFGKILSLDQHIYINAEDDSILLINHWDNEVRIMGIKRKTS